MTAAESQSRRPEVSTAPAGPESMSFREDPSVPSNATHPRSALSVFLDALARDYHRQLIRFARRLTGGDHEAMDLCNEAWAELFANPDRVEGLTQVEAYWELRDMVRVAWRRTGRHRSRVRPSDPDVLDQNPDTAVEDDLAWQRLVDEWTYARLFDQLAKLTRRQQVAMLLHIMGFSARDTGDALGVLERTARYHLVAAERHLERLGVRGTLEIPAILPPALLAAMVAGGEADEPVVHAVAVAPDIADPPPPPPASHTDQVVSADHLTHVAAPGARSGTVEEVLTGVGAGLRALGRLPADPAHWVPWGRSVLTAASALFIAVVAGIAVVSGGGGDTTRPQQPATAGTAAPVVVTVTAPPAIPPTAKAPNPEPLRDARARVPASLDVARVARVTATPRRTAPAAPAPRNSTPRAASRAPIATARVSPRPSSSFEAAQQSEFR